MRSFSILFIILINLIFQVSILAQPNPVTPSVIDTGIYLGQTPPLRDLPRISDEEWQGMIRRSEEKMLNRDLDYRDYPFAETALPKGPDPLWQRSPGSSREVLSTLVNFQGQTCSGWPPDANGAIGHLHYMQTINTTYAIYDRAGNLIAGPTALNTLFSGVPGSSYNDGDPIVLYDEQADRWFVAELTFNRPNDYMLVAVSTTNDPTGTWHKYAFDVTNLPDYPKFGIWQDGYYMSINNIMGADIFVFERSQMLHGQTARMVGFDNPNRPTTTTGFAVCPPVDNDGAFAPAGAPGIFIACNDDAVGGGLDQLWIFELDVDWTTPANSTFSRVQQINVASFDSNFGTDQDNIKQPGTSIELDAIPQIIMNPPQYRNFGSYQTIVCCHTVDVDNTDHAGIRWYELRKTGDSWSIRQQGTYAPDGHSRWMGSIMLNGFNEIALGYSISSSTEYPGIRFCGQSATEYASATGLLDCPETTIHNGTNSQSTYNRWGDYSSMAVDLSDDKSFWFSSEYIGSTGSRETKVAHLQFGAIVLDANFIANNRNPLPGDTITFTDLSTGSPSSWIWNFSPSTVTFHNGTSSSSQNPQVSFNESNYYMVTLTVSDGSSNDTETRMNYINAHSPGLWTGDTSAEWNLSSNWDGAEMPDRYIDVIIPDSSAHWPEYSGNLTIGTQCKTLTLSGASQMTVNGDLTISLGSSLNFTNNGTLNLTGHWNRAGSFNPGNGTVSFIGTGTANIAAGDMSDITTYTRANFAKGMETLSGSTVILAGADELTVVVPIGFTFKYLDISYTQVKVCSNGWLSLNQSGTVNLYNNSYLFSSTLPNTTIAPWWDDLRDDATSVISYKTEGSEPDRVFVAEFYQVRSYSASITARISFQVRLFETSNKIEFHYGDLVAGTHSALESASIGIEDATGGTNHFIEGTTGSTTTGITNLVSTTNWPTTNFRFSPPVAEETFFNITLNKTVNINVNINVNGAFNLSPGSNFIIPANRQVNVNGYSY